jgi:hypothetical protein
MDWWSGEPRMRKIQILVAIALLVVGALIGAALDTPLMNAVNPQPQSFVFHDRAERLERFPPPSPVAFVGDSHVERGPWWMLDVANYGIGGDTAEGVLSRIGRIGAERFVILVGVNDIIAGRDPAAIAEDIGRIVAGRNVTLLSVLPVRDRYASHNAKIAELNSLLPAVCSEPCTFVDTWPTMATDGELDARYTNDGLHLNSDGYASLTPLLGDFDH